MDGPLRKVTLRVEHDCPLARLSRAVPRAAFRSWSGHSLEVVEVRCAPDVWPDVEENAARLLDPLRVLPLGGGGVLVWEPHVEAERSLSRVLEANQVVWMQPVRVEAGWEHYDAIAVGAGRGKASGKAPEQAAISELARRWPTQVARRSTVEAESMVSSLFHSLAPILDSPTPKQAEALAVAAREGYYRSPRSATTAQLAERMGLGRSAFEERLRGAENRILGVIGPILAEQVAGTEGAGAKGKGDGAGAGAGRAGTTAKRKGGVGPSWTSA
jgi:predicted DNA binding protein